MFNIHDEIRHAIACRNFKLAFELIARLNEEEQRKEEYFQKFLEDDHKRCVDGF